MGVNNLYYPHLFKRKSKNKLIFIWKLGKLYLPLYPDKIT